MKGGASEVLRIDNFASCCLDQRRASKEDRAVLVHDDALVGHGRYVGAAGRARAHDDGDLRNVERRHGRLIVEDSTKVIAVREHIGRERQERTAAIDCTHTHAHTHAPMHSGSAWTRGWVEYE